jgi:peptidoglycan/LPS O-acetylase OafA/YrhL
VADATDRPSYVPALDGLRAFAVMLVMWGHVPLGVPGYPEWLAVGRGVMSPGEFGVEIFFVLSGFLITRILLAERRRQQPVRWFLLRRLLRIFPIYYLLIAVMAFVQPGPALWWCTAYLGNVYVMTHENASLLPHTWSLCVEEHFYLLWPIAVAFLPVRWPLRLMAGVVMPCGIVGAFLVCHWVEPALSDKIVRFGSPFRFFGLGAGCLLAFWEPTLRARLGRALLLGLGLVVTGVLLWPVFWVLFAPEVFGFGLPMRQSPTLGLLYSSALSAGIVLTVLSGSFAGSALVRPMAWWLPRSIGRISYGLYLYHWPIYWLVFAGGLTPQNVALAIGLTFAVATVSYWLIERPLLKLGSRFR